MLIPGLVFSLASLVVSTAIQYLFILRDPIRYPALLPDKNVLVNWRKILNLAMIAVCLISLLILMNYQTGWSMFIVIPLVSLPFALTAAFLQNKIAAFKREMKNYYRERLCKGQAELCLFVSAGFLGAALERSGAVASLLTQMPPFIVEYKLLLIFIVISFIMLTAVIGVHPVVMVPVLATSITPASIGFDKLTFAMMLLSGWILGVTFSPFSASSMIMSSLEGISPWQVGPVANWQYVFVMLFVFSLFVWLFPANHIYLVSDAIK
jgi:hypothetical protein